MGVLLISFMSTACTVVDNAVTPGISGDNGEVKEADMQGAADYVDSVLDDSLSAINPPVEWEHLRVRESTCHDDPRDIPYQTGAVTRKRAIVTEIANSRHAEIVRNIQEQWSASGFEVDDSNVDREYPVLTAVTRDEFRLMVSVNSVGQILFTMASPCFEEVEVAPPSSGPEYTGDHRPSPPDVHSDYWSEGG